MGHGLINIFDEKSLIVQSPQERHMSIRISNSSTRFVHISLQGWTSSILKYAIYLKTVMCIDEINLLWSNIMIDEINVWTFERLNFAFELLTETVDTIVPHIQFRCWHLSLDVCPHSWNVLLLCLKMLHSQIVTICTRHSYINKRKCCCVSGNVFVIWKNHRSPHYIYFR